MEEQVETGQELEIILIAFFYLIGLPMLILSVVIVSFLFVVNYIHEQRKRKFDEMIRKLVYIADGDVGLMGSAVKNTAVGGKSDLKDVVDYIKQHRKQKVAP